MWRFLAVLAFFGFPFFANAQSRCPANTTPILTCTFSNGAKALVACHDGLTAHYAFGKMGKRPDLSLSAPVVSLAYVPWPGVGSAIWDEVGFTNNGVNYVLWQNYSRRPDQEPTLTAGIVVEENGNELARLECDSGSIIPAIDQLWNVFEASGQCYDRTNSTWAPCE